MLTKLICRNFKCFGQIEVELGNPVVFIGPNNSGKTAALQALALWEVGLKRWNENRKGRTNPEKRPGVTINRRDLISVPVPDAKLLWKNLRVQAAQRPGGRNICIDIIVEGVTAEKKWECGLEFYYANPESFYCRPLRLSETERMPVPDEAAHLDVAFLPPMSGLVSNETRLDEGAINVRIGEGRTAEVLRNLCYQVEQQNRQTWETVCAQIRALFGVQLENPIYIRERGEIAMNYRDRTGISLDLSSSGRGLQQTLLLLSYIAAHPGSVLLLDEPDAHLEILRQRQIYQTLTELATEHNSQIVAASHSEVILNEAAERDIVIAFIGKPHRIDSRGGQQLRKSLTEIGYEKYYQAALKGWVLYLEGPTDFAILKAFAEKLAHPVQEALESPFVEYVGNRPQKAREQFRGLQEAKPNLVGFCLFDRLGRELQETPELKEYAWTRREIENYLCYKDVLLAWAKDEAEQQAGELFAGHWTQIMDESISEIESALVTLGRGSPWSSDIKVSDDFLEPLFETFFKKLGVDNLMRKTNYHRLVPYVPAAKIDSEVSDVLDWILAVATQGVPLT